MKLNDYEKQLIKVMIMNELNMVEAREELNDDDLDYINTLKNILKKMEEE